MVLYFFKRWYCKDEWKYKTVFKNIIGEDCEFNKFGLTALCQSFFIKNIEDVMRKYLDMLAGDWFIYSRSFWEDGIYLFVTCIGVIKSLPGFILVWNILRVL